MFNFHAQNDIGKRGEQLFLDTFPNWSMNNHVKCTEPDFIDKYGRTAEIKFDVSKRARRDSNGHQLNFFMETISNDRKNTLGGIFRAHKEKVKFFVYIFENPQRFFIMDVKKALKRTQELIKTGKYRQCRIKNPYYYTIGYPLPISEFKECLLSPKHLNSQPFAIKKMKRKLECTLKNTAPKRRKRILSKIVHV